MRRCSGRNKEGVGSECSGFVWSQADADSTFEDAELDADGFSSGERGNGQGRIEGSFFGTGLNDGSRYELGAAVELPVGIERGFFLKSWQIKRDERGVEGLPPSLQRYGLDPSNRDADLAELLHGGLHRLGGNSQHHDMPQPVVKDGIFVERSSWRELESSAIRPPEFGEFVEVEGLEHSQVITLRVVIPESEFARISLVFGKGLGKLPGHGEEREVIRFPVITERHFT